jgi:CubicO group peptidase (beta-lactamase class C family)
MPARKALTARLMLVLLWAIATPARAGAPDAVVPSSIWPTQAWPVSSPEEQGMDSTTLARLVQVVGERRQDSLLIIRHGRIVVEAYHAPYTAGIPHDLRSVTKSVVSTLIAIALRQGLLDTVEQPVVPLFPDKRIANLDNAKKSISMQNLLDMTSGIDWRERNYTPDETISQMYRSPDHTEFVLSQPMSSLPGTRFYYDSGNPYLLSAIITRKTGKNAFAYAQSELFEPLGIHDAHWDRLDAQGVTDGESGLYLTPRDMAKIGYLYLHNGAWDGREIIPASWVARARAGAVAATGGFHYANLWWSLPEWDAYMARGRHSQLIMVRSTSSQS